MDPHVLWAPCEGHGSIGILSVVSRLQPGLVLSGYANKSPKLNLFSSDSILLSSLSLFSTKKL